MTPERKEEINRNVKMLLNPEQYSMDEFHNAADIMDERKVEWIVGLLAALEEAQQQVEEQRDINEGVREMARDWHAEAKHWKTEHERSQGELAEAQQTIARQREALEKIMGVTGADYEDSFNKAINIAYLALGLGEGAKES